MKRFHPYCRFGAWFQNGSTCGTYFCHSHSTSQARFLGRRLLSGRAQKSKTFYSNLLIGKETIISPSTANQHDDRCHLPAHPRPKALRLKHVQEKPLLALTTAVSAHSTGLEFNPQSSNHDFPCAYLPAVLKGTPTLYHFLTSSPQHYHLCPRICLHSFHVLQAVCEDFVGITLPHAAPLYSQGLHHYAGRSRAFAGVTQSHTTPLYSRAHTSPSLRCTLRTCRLQRPRRRPGRPMVGFNHLAPPSSSTHLGYVRRPPPL